MRCDAPVTPLTLTALLKTVTARFAPRGTWMVSSVSTTFSFLSVPPERRLASMVASLPSDVISRVICFRRSAGARRTAWTTSEFPSVPVMSTRPEKFFTVNVPFGAI